MLDDGSRQVRPELLPFRDGFAAMRNPRAGVSWMRHRHVEQMLRTLARPETPLTHETLDSMTPWRSVAYLRDLPMQHGVLPPVDRHLVLFDAQPLTRILKLTLDDVLDDNGEISIRLGDPPVPIPQPFANLLRQHLDQRLNLTTATNRDARWLFPDRRAGQPRVASTIQIRLRTHGIPALSDRTAALRQLVLQAPAPVIATILGYTQQHTARTATNAGDTWSRYAPGEHTRLHDQRTRDS